MQGRVTKAEAIDFGRGSEWDKTNREYYSFLLSLIERAATRPLTHAGGATLSAAPASASLMPEPVRAPTPTAAAEMAVPVRAELMSRVSDLDTRLRGGVAQRLDAATQLLRAAERGLLNPAEMVERRAQSVDLAVAGLERGLQRCLSAAEIRVTDLGARLRPPERRLAEVGAELAGLDTRLHQQIEIQLDRRRVALASAVRLLDANSFERVLERGFALVTTPEGAPVKRAAEAVDGAEVTIRFADAPRNARLDPSGPATSGRRRSASKPKASNDQDSLF